MPTSVACLECQVTDWNDRKCPLEFDRRKRRERSGRAREFALGMESIFGSMRLDNIGVRSESSQEGCDEGPNPRNNGKFRKKHV